MSSVFKDITSLAVWPLIKAAMVLLVTSVAARMASYVVARWSKRTLNKLRDKQKTSAVQTRNEVLKRLTSLLVYLAGVIVLVSQYPQVKNLGVGLFASAGVIGVVLGFAAQSTLSNMIAGIVLSFSQPLRLGDAVILDNDFGYIEEITLMQTFIKTWDNRRIIVPNDVLSNRIIHNWSIKDPRLLAATLVYVDYRCDVDRLTGWIVDAVKSSGNWNGEGEPVVQVIDFSEKTATVRALAWAEDPPSAWGLRCDIRERLMEKFREEGVDYPKLRVTVEQEELANSFGGTRGS